MGLPHHFALKDQWIDIDQFAEGPLLEKLCVAIQSEMKKGLFHDMDLTGDPVDCFLSVKAYSRAKLSNTSEDSTQTIMQGLSLPDSSSGLSIPFEWQDLA